MTVVSAAPTPEAANHSRLKAARVIEFKKRIGKPVNENKQVFSRANDVLDEPAEIRPPGDARSK
jgi:hypothetical protein